MEWGLDVDVHRLRQIEREQHLRLARSDGGRNNLNAVEVFDLPIRHLQLDRAVETIEPLDLHQVGIDRSSMRVLVRLVAVELEHRFVNDRELHVIDRR